MDVVDKVKQGLGSGAASGKEDMGEWLLTIATSPMGVALIIGAVLFMIWKRR